MTTVQLGRAQSSVVSDLRGVGNGLTALRATWDGPPCAEFTRAVTDWLAACNLVAQKLQEMIEVLEGQRTGISTSARMTPRNLEVWHRLAPETLPARNFDRRMANSVCADMAAVAEKSSAGLLHLHRQMESTVDSWAEGALQAYEAASAQWNAAVTRMAHCATAAAAALDRSLVE